MSANSTRSICQPLASEPAACSWYRQPRWRYRSVTEAGAVSRAIAALFVLLFLSTNMALAEKQWGAQPSTQVSACPVDSREHVVERAVEEGCAARRHAPITRAKTARRGGALAKLQRTTVTEIQRLMNWMRPGTAAPRADRFVPERDGVQRAAPSVPKSAVTSHAASKPDKSPRIHSTPEAAPLPSELPAAIALITIGVLFGWLGGRIDPRSRVPVKRLPARIPRCCDVSARETFLCRTAREIDTHTTRATLEDLIPWTNDRALPGVPHASVEPWTAGSASDRGPVRCCNEDNVLCYAIGDHCVALVADGCGATPLGARASCLAVLSAAASIVNLIDSPSGQWLSPQAIATRALFDAQIRLMIEARRLGLELSPDSLRTTLIVAVSDYHELGIAYIGDGGALIVRADGQVEQLMTPQKANASNVLAASLGPSMEGGPLSGRVTLCGGEVIVLGSDGVFDRVGASFGQDLVRASARLGGDLQVAVQQALEEMCDATDEQGYLFDDNVTLAVLADGTAPPWTATAESAEQALAAFS